MDPIHTKNLITKCGDEKKAIEWLTEEIVSSRIPFPYRRLYSEPPEDFFSRLKEYQPKIQQFKYRLHAYYPKYKLFLPPLFRGNPIVVVSSRHDYDTIDILSDLFVENIRLSTVHRNYQQMISPFDAWYTRSVAQQIATKALRYPIITSRVLRELLNTEVKESKQFRPTWVKSLIYLMYPSMSSGSHERLSILDISAGWGDRLLTAMSLDFDYLGFDPNRELQGGHDLMIKKFGSPDRHKVLYLPFEDADIPEGKFDLVLSSPPFYNLEEYSSEPTQSIIRYPTFMEWLVKFLFSSLEKAWRGLKDGGYLAIHIGDTYQTHLCEPMNLFIEQLLPWSSFEGVVGLIGESNIARPMWIWKKVMTSPRSIWSPPITKRPFYQLYPEIRNNWISVQLRDVASPLVEDIYNKKKSLINQLIKRVTEITDSKINRRQILTIIPESALLALLDEANYDGSDSSALDNVVVKIISIIQIWNHNF